jgi:HlyD family secretion protein
MPQKNVFRDAALDRLASPERLDQPIKVTGPKAWLALSALGLLLATLIGWGFQGRINRRVDGQGILLSGDVQEVVPRWPGRVTILHVGPGEEVVAGQLVAELDQPELGQAIENARARLLDLQQEDEYLQDIATRELAIQRSSYSEQRANLERMVSEQEALLRLVASELDRQQQLLDEGHLPEGQLIAAHESHNSTRTQLAATRAELTRVQLDELNARFVVEQRLIASEKAIHEAEREIRRLQNDMALQSRVYTSYGGRVLELTADEGAVVPTGGPLMRISLTDQEVRTLRAVIYVGGVDAKRVEPDMVTQISPSAVRPEEYGYILGTVERVSEFPATLEGMRRALKNEQLVGQISSLGTVFEVHVTLAQDSATTSGFAWTSGGGPDVTILDGTPAVGRIIVETRRPVQIVIPGLKKMLALY